jgi:hypothetical protein
MDLSFTASSIPAKPILTTPATANLATGHMPQSMAKDVEMLPRTMFVAAHIGQSTLGPSSFFGQLNIYRYTVSRLFLFPTETQKLDHDQKKRREFIRGVIVTKTETSNDTSDKPKDD